MSEIVNRLKSMYITHTPSASYAQVDPVTIGEAADEITRLAAENQRLKSEALFTAISVLPEKDAEIETLTARVKELEKRLATAVADMDRMGFSPIWLEPSRAALSQPTTTDTA
jgi:predicted transcriptional regulator